MNQVTSQTLYYNYNKPKQIKITTPGLIKKAASAIAGKKVA